MTRTKGVLIITGSTIIALILALTADMNQLELGALLNLIIPPLVGVLCLIIFIVTWEFTNSRRTRFAVLLIVCFYLLYIGLAYHFDKAEFWPLVFP